jgi:uncharacterized membrane protein YeaQ/YmgE (transglycosylase-associated protein family)
MALVAWIDFGLIIGFIASKLVRPQGSAIFLDVVLGIAGAVLGGWLFGALGPAGVPAGVSLYGTLVCIAGALCLLSVPHVLERGRRLAA